MADIFDEIAAGVSGAESQDIPTLHIGAKETVAAPDIFDEIAASAHQQLSPNELLGSPSTPTEAAARTLVGGASRFIPFGDEIVAGGTSLMDALFRKANLSDAYDARLNEVRNYQDAFSALPGGSVAAPIVDIAGAIALPFKSKVPTLTGTAKAIQAAKEGAALSSLYGFAGGEGTGNRIEDAATSGAFGALFSPIATKTVDALGGLFSSIGSKFSRKSIGASYGDYLKTADELQSIATPEGEAVTKTKQVLDDLIGSDAFGSSRNPAKLVDVANKAQSSLSEKIGGVIQKYEKANPAPVHPTFENAIDYLQSGKVPADQIERYLNRLSTLDEVMSREGKGSLSFLQQQKVAIGKSYDPKDGVLNGFNRAIYQDLQKTIEKAVPEVAPLNAELAKWKTVEPILKRSLARSEATDPIGKGVALWRTSGGFGVPILAANSVGGPLAALPVAAASLLTTAKGQQVAGSALNGVAGMFESLPVTRLAPEIASSSLKSQKNASQKIPASSESPQSTENPSIDSKRVESAVRLLMKEDPTAQRSKQETMSVDSRSSSNSTTNSSGNLPMGLFSKKPVKAVESLIDSNPFDAAVYEMESGRDPSAKNPKSSAAGGFQLIKATQKALGVSDPYDLGENYAGFKKLTDENRARFGDDPRLLYSAHFLGATLLAKVLRGDELTDTQKAQVQELEKVALPRFMKIYTKKAGGLTEA